MAAVLRPCFFKTKSEIAISLKCVFERPITGKIPHNHCRQHHNHRLNIYGTSEDCINRSSHRAEGFPQKCFFRAQNSNRFPSTSRHFATSRDRVSGDQVQATTSKPASRAVIALGSNVGDRLANIENACREMDRELEIKVTRTSAIYETEPMYVEDQDAFLNAVCQIQTTLQPFELLDRLQAIEKRLGRVKTIDKGPRSVDLDIILFEDVKLKSDRLTIPHALLTEREFVLRPLCDIQRHRYIPTDGDSKQTVAHYLRKLPEAKPPMLSQTPLTATGRFLRPNDSRRRTHLMSILNLTPDSFSDGGMYDASEIDSLLSVAKAHYASGTSIIDIGGQSSRPNAEDVTAEVEISRILPAIQAIRSSPTLADMIISVDTYRAKVAEAAVEAGADIINDISAGLLDPDMLPTISRLGCTYVMMHMRGTPATMQSEENCSYPRGLIPTVATELSRRIAAAQDAGIRRWRLILDPGIGFAKTAPQNAQLLRNFYKLRSDPRLANIPWLVGTSRKSFIGTLADVSDPKSRDWPTAVALTASVYGGADIVRVHNAQDLSKVVKMADAIYRA